MKNGDLAVTDEEYLDLACGCAQAAYIEAVRQTGLPDNVKDLNDVTEFQYMTAKAKIVFREKVIELSARKTAKKSWSVPEIVFYKTIKGII